MTPTPADREALKAARNNMRLPSDPAEAEDINLRDLVEQAVNRKLAAMRANGCHTQPTTIPGN